MIISATHEVPHLVPAAHSGATLERFAIGMLQRLCAFTTGNAQRAVNAAPVGGFVALPTDDEHPLEAQCPGPGYGGRMAIVRAGSVANISCVPGLIGPALAVPRAHLTAVVRAAIDPGTSPGVGISTATPRRPPGRRVGTTWGHPEGDAME